MEAAEKLYWVKAALGVLLGFLFGRVQPMLPLSGYSFFAVGLLMNFLLSDLLGRQIGVERPKAWKIGIGAYLFTWLAVWVITYTLSGSPH